MHEPDTTDESLEPSRSQLRREALDIFKLAESLVQLGETELARVPLDADVHAEVLRARAIPSHIARKRQTQFLAKQMRKLDDDAIEAIRGALTHDREKAHRETAGLHRLEIWRERLITGGDEALTELLAQYPNADRQQLRQLVRNVLAERAKNKPPHAYRELFRVLRELAAETSPP
jgi:ribosome-associated protein